MTDTPKQYRLRQNIKAKLHREGNVYEIIGQKGRFIQKEVFERDYEPVRGDGWRPIDENTPRDVDLLLFCPEKGQTNHEMIELGFYHCTRGGWYHPYATHFMPLPTPPKTEEQQG